MILNLIFFNLNKMRDGAARRRRVTISYVIRFSNEWNTIQNFKNKILIQLSNLILFKI